MLKRIVAFIAVFGLADAKVGELRTYKYETSGTVYIKNDKELVIDNFKYNGRIQKMLNRTSSKVWYIFYLYTGRGPDAFFYVGAELPVGHDTGVLIQHPSGSDAPLKKIDGINITLTLPGELKTSQLKWLSVWCRKFSVNFADITSFPANSGDTGDSSGSPQQNVFMLDKLLASAFISVLLALTV